MEDISVETQLLEELYQIIQEWERTEGQQHQLSEDEYLSKLDEYQRKLDEFEDKYNVSDIGKGRDRITFSSGSLVTSSSEVSYVIKFSLSDGYQQNDEEIRLWENLGSDAREHVARLYGWDDNRRWIIQERVSQITSTSSATQTVIENLESCGWVGTDIRPENVGERPTTNHPVLMDLGIGLREK
jgi:hypothetical protein